MDLKLEDDSSLATRVYDLLEEAILTGKIALGSRILESELSEQLKVSRAPLREALQRLHFEGLARTIPRRGTYVIEPSVRDVINLLQVREQLECLAARLAATRITDEQLARLRDGLSRIRTMIASERAEGYPQHDIDFHKSVVQISGNERVEQILAGIYRQIRLVRHVSGAQVQRGEKALDEHCDILTALEARRPEFAEAAMRSHIRASAHNIIDILTARSGTDHGLVYE